MSTRTLFSLCLFLIVRTVFGSDPTLPTTVFDGEKLVYKLSYKGWITADATMRASLIDSQPEAPVLYIHSSIRTGPLAGIFFHVQNEYATWLDLQKILPLRYEKSIDQSNIRQSMTITYDHEHRTARRQNGQQWPIEKKSMDLFSMLYALRAFCCDDDSLIRFTLDVESQSWHLAGPVQKSSAIDGAFQHLPLLCITMTFTPAGTLSCREWKTDLLTNRIAGIENELVVCLGPQPVSLPVLIRFGSPQNRVEMRLVKRIKERPDKIR